MESQVGPPGYDPGPGTVAKPKSKSVKRNERKKEKKQQVLPLCKEVLINSCTSCIVVGYITIILL